MRTLRRFAGIVLVAALAGGCGTSPEPRFASAPSQTPTTSGDPAASATAAASPSAGASGSAVSPSSMPKAPAGPAHFTTLPPGSKLPSESQCAAWARAKPFKENKKVNAAANATKGQKVDGSLFGDGSPAASRIAPRISGNFTGTTQTILRWTACKWGIDEDIVYAQTAIESWWRQDTLGDWGTDASACPPGHGLGADGKAGQCPQSYGVLQDRWPYMKQGWPGYARSTAMAADIAYAIWRSCFEGYETWLNTVERGQTYKAGDAWGCVGRWFSGRWHTQPGEDYVKRVKDYLAQRIWTTPNFQQ